MSPSKSGSRSKPSGEHAEHGGNAERGGHADRVMNRNDDHTHDEEDSGCECSLEELEGLDAWTKTMVSVRVSTAFKMRRRKKLEQQEREKKERRKTLWKRLGFKLRIFRLFAKQIKSDVPEEESLIKLKKKLGKPSTT